MNKITGVFALCFLLATPQSQTVDVNPAWFVAVPAAYCIFSCYNKESQANPQFKGNPKKLRSMNVVDLSWWKNLYDLFDEWVIGQRGKERLLKTTKEGHVKVSSKKCSAHGFTGKMLEHLDTVDKSRKALMNVAFMYFVYLAAKGHYGKNILEKFFNFKDEEELLKTGNSVSSGNPTS